MDNGGAITDRLIEQANITHGSRALDVGCAGGDVTFRLSRAVGAHGEVLGIDLNPVAIEAARQKAQSAGIKNTIFAKRDIETFAGSGEAFDVITCRRVLMYLPKQVEIAKFFKRLLNPNGVLIIQEHDASIMHSSSPLPLHQQARSWIWDTVKAEGANVGTGFDLHHILSSAGFSEISISADAIVETPTQSAQTADIVKVMIPRIEAAGISTAAEIDVETLKQRLTQERRSNAATVIGEMVFGAIARP